MAAGWPLVAQCPSQFPRIPGLLLCSSSPKDKMRFDPSALVFPPVLLQTSLEWETPATKKARSSRKCSGKHTNSGNHLCWGLWNVTALPCHQFLWRQGQLNMHYVATHTWKGEGARALLDNKTFPFLRSLLPFAIICKLFALHKVLKLMKAKLLGFPEQWLRRDTKWSCIWSRHTGKEQTLLLSSLSALRHNLHLLHMQLNIGFLHKEGQGKWTDPLAPVARFRSLKCLVWRSQWSLSEQPESNAGSKGHKKERWKAKKRCKHEPRTQPKGTHSSTQAQTTMYQKAATVQRS